MTLGEAAVVLAGALVGGFVNGLTGFGTALTALGVWLWVLPPATAASLVVITTVAAQIQALPFLKGNLDLGRALPYVIPGLLAAPLGTAALGFVDAGSFKLAMGVFLVGYSTVALVGRPPRGTTWGGRVADAGVGLAGGFLGGLAGLSGALVALWSDIRALPKEPRRSLLQVFNLSITALALLSHVVAGWIGASVLLATMIALPGTFVGGWLGGRAYERLGDGDYRRIVLGLLLLSGLALCLGR